MNPIRSTSFRNQPGLDRRPVAGLVAAAAALLAACGQPASPAPEAARPAYVTEVRAGDRAGLAFAGEVRALQRAEPAFAVAGRVVTVAVEPGDTVRAGQVLAVLDTVPLQAQLAAASGELARAEAARQEAKQRAERLRNALQAEAASGAEVDAVRAEVAATEAAARTAQAHRDQAAWQLAQATLRAPAAGVVAQRAVEPGQAAAPGVPAFVIDGAGRELAVLVPASMALKPGTAVRLTHNGTETASRVLRVGGRLEAGGVKRVMLAVPSEATVGSTWTVLLDTRAAAAPAALQVPLRAVLPGAAAGSGQVLRLAKDGRTVEAVAVKTGALSGDAIEISAGLSAGDRVVVAGAASIRPGSAVKPVDYRGPGVQP